MKMKMKINELFEELAFINSLNELMYRFYKYNLK